MSAGFENEITLLVEEWQLVICDMDIKKAMIFAALYYKDIDKRNQLNPDESLVLDIKFSASVIIDYLHGLVSTSDLLDAFVFFEEKEYFKVFRQNKEGPIQKEEKFFVNINRQSIIDTCTINHGMYSYNTCPASYSSARLLDNMGQNDECPKIDNTKIKNDKKGNVYLMKNLRNKYHKIGYTSSDPKFREKTLQSQEPEVILVWSCKGRMSDEKKIHEIFDSKRLRGEWFDLNEEDVKFITSGDWKQKTKA